VTTSQLLGDLSETLAGGAPMLSRSEKELVANLMQQMKTRSLTTGSDLAGNLTQALSEALAQRICTLLGKSIAENFLQQLNAPQKEHPARTILFSPPGPTPRDPVPPPPIPPPTGPPGITMQEQQEIVDLIPANCAILEEFLVPQELDSVVRYALEHEAAFKTSQVVAPGGGTSMVDYEYRRSRVLMELGGLRNVIVQRLQSCWPQLLRRLGYVPFRIANIEAQITASNDGDYFRSHSDNGHEETSKREITFVYFFHREPKNFTGGELRIYDSRIENGAYVKAEHYRSITPRQNQLVVFPSSLTHEITRVECPSGAFADSRFTVNGWFHR
jgi:Rps23 Pro-64 3,4-dihydroxylase Tpa1-like proline 4-hydroxylase